MTKEHEQFLLRCELTKAIVTMIWTKGVITDQERDKAIDYLTKKFKEEEITKFIKKYGSNPVVGYEFQAFVSVRLFYPLHFVDFVSILLHSHIIVYIL